MRALCLAPLGSILIACMTPGDDPSAPPTRGADANAASAPDASALHEAGSASEAGVHDEAGVSPGLRDAGDDAQTPRPPYPTRPIATPPDYQGSLNNGAACTTTYATGGFEPATDDDTRYPLFLYFVGTAFSGTDPSNKYDNPAAYAVAEAMARRGFVALSAAYDNGVLSWLSDHRNQLHCLFEAPDGLLARACALPQVDCALGIATWGHSQGGLVAMMAGDYDARVRAAWATGYGGEQQVSLSKHRVRVVNGEADLTNGTAAVLNAITGLTPALCPDPDQCLRDDGSGWVIVRKAALADPMRSTADHCWFDRRACSDATLSLEPTWIDPNSTRAYALEANADWLAITARRTDLP